MLRPYVTSIKMALEAATNLESCIRKVASMMADSEIRCKICYYLWGRRDCTSPSVVQSYVKADIQRSLVRLNKASGVNLWW